MNLRLASLSAFVGLVAVLALYQTAARAIGSIGIGNCATATACIGGSNTSGGPGVYAGSADGNGLLAQTSKIANAPAAGVNAVLGQDVSSSGAFNTGVRGTTLRGTGVAGAATVGIGVEGTATGSSGVGIIGTSAKGDGILGASQAATGIEGITYAPSKNTYPSTYATANYGVEGIDLSAGSGTHNAGIYGESAHGTGVAGYTKNGVGVFGYSSSTTAIAALSESTRFPAMTAAGRGDIFKGYGTGYGNPYLMIVDNHANIHIDGQVYTEGQCAACSPAHALRSYGTSATTPSLEDAGEAQLRNGAAYVPLDPSFASAIDSGAGYIVVVTPEADTRGLFVTARTMRGFEVRELMSGRSNIPFAYRILAHPYGVRAPRLPLVSRELPSASELRGLP